jgi:hypothetical protein
VDTRANRVDIRADCVDCVDRRAGHVYTRVDCVDTRADRAANPPSQGDTTADWITSEDPVAVDALRAKLLICECTFVDDVAGSGKG